MSNAQNEELAIACQLTYDTILKACQILEKKGFITGHCDSRGIYFHVNRSFDSSVLIEKSRKICF